MNGIIGRKVGHLGVAVRVLAIVTKNSKFKSRSIICIYIFFVCTIHLYLHICMYVYIHEYIFEKTATLLYAINQNNRIKLKKKDIKEKLSQIN